MDLLLKNPLADMSGPFFLCFYGALLVIFLVLARRVRKGLDTSRLLGPLPVPENPNPFEIAFLRGGGNEVARLLMVDLFHHGIIVELPKNFFKKAKLKLADGVDLSSLDPTMQKLAEKFVRPRDPLSLTGDSIKDVMGDQLQHWSKWVRDEQLVFEQEQRNAAKNYGQLLAGVFVVIGLYKFAVAIVNGHLNVGFLTFVGLAGYFSLMLMTRLPKFTTRGRRYLDNLQTAYASYRNSVLPKPGTEQLEPAANNAAWDPLLVGSFAMPVMAMGLFGATALQSSYYESFRQRFAPHSSGSTCGAGLCGSGCGAAGSGGDSGGGCGGGCGGCGGCGG